MRSSRAAAGRADSTGRHPAGGAIRTARVVEHHSQTGSTSGSAEAGTGLDAARGADMAGDLSGGPAHPMREPHLRTVRLLAECFQAFERASGGHVRALGLTPPQFDIIATLGRTRGLTFRELGERTLITKGTLTGIIDRLEARGFVARVASDEDRRSTIVRLTAQGESLFEQVFPAHVAYLRDRFDGWSEADFRSLERQLVRLRDALGRSVPER